MCMNADESGRSNTESRAGGEAFDVVRREVILGIRKACALLEDARNSGDSEGMSEEWTERGAKFFDSCEEELFEVSRIINYVEPEDDEEEDIEDCWQGESSVGVVSVLEQSDYYLDQPGSLGREEQIEAIVARLKDRIDSNPLATVGGLRRSAFEYFIYLNGKDAGDSYYTWDIPASGVFVKVVEGEAYED